MDLLQEIRNKIDQIKKFRSIEGLQAVITHIERAEKFLEQGKSNGDNHLFTDVIYRTNHAFEGILKEAYSVLSSKLSDKATPAEIEKYFAKESVFHQRILDMFQEYRQKWRNPSTHDYKLFFSEDEAFMAIVTISAFVNILLNQLYEKLSYEHEKSLLQTNKDQIVSNIPDFGKMDFFNKVEAVVLKFANSLSTPELTTKAMKEYEYTGMLTAYLEESGVAKAIAREPSFVDKNGVVLRPDLQLTGDEDIFIDLKIVKNGRIDKTIESQMVLYLHHSKVKRGIILILSEEPDVPYYAGFTAYSMEDDSFGISLIYRREK